MVTKSIATIFFVASCYALPAGFYITASTNGNVTLSWESEPGVTYTVIKSSTPTFLNQATISHLMSSTGSVQMTTTASGKNGYFKIKQKSNPLFGSSFFVNPKSQAEQQINAWGTNDPERKVLIEKISREAQGNWLTGRERNLSGMVSDIFTVAHEQQTIPIFVVYNIPKRDCSSYSAGGAPDAETYLEWCSTLTTALKQGGPCVIILEPDALAALDCLNSEEQQVRLHLIEQASQMFKKEVNAFVYIDAGHSHWMSASTMSIRLKAAGISSADGFSLNVSNFNFDEEEIRFGESLSKLLDDAHFVIDTSRNGLGQNKDSGLLEPWCNPPGRALGKRPTSDTGHALVDAFLWIKNPGESDGNCRAGEPTAGAWWLDYALGLAERAAY